MANTNVTMRIDETLKSQLQELMSNLGLDMTTFFTMAAKQAVREQALPFHPDMNSGIYGLQAYKLAMKNTNYNSAGKATVSSDDECNDETEWDDNDKNYLFITPSGNVKEHIVDKVLFVQNIKARETMEVVMKAEGLNKTTIDEIQKIFYAGVNIVDIFNKNLYHGESDVASLGSMATFQARDVRFPANGKRIILTVDENYETEDENVIVILLDTDKRKIVGQGMRTYLSSESYPLIYNKIEKLFEDDLLWNDINTTQKMITDGSYTRSNISFLEIIRKENDELIISNLLTYYFNYDHSLFVKFAKDVLGINQFDVSFEIIRESMGNIDLWIRDKKHIIIYLFLIIIIFQLMMILKKNTE